ncbi:MAG: HEAT repeat domain-containing protein, partial [Thermoplasmata archaeon]
MSGETSGASNAPKREVYSSNEYNAAVSMIQAISGLPIEMQTEVYSAFAKSSDPRIRAMTARHLMSALFSIEDTAGRILYNLSIDEDLMVREALFDSFQNSFLNLPESFRDQMLIVFSEDASAGLRIAAGNLIARHFAILNHHIKLLLGVLASDEDVEVQKAVCLSILKNIPNLPPDMAELESKIQRYAQYIEKELVVEDKVRRVPTEQPAPKILDKEMTSILADESNLPKLLKEDFSKFIELAIKYSPNPEVRKKAAVALLDSIENMSPSQFDLLLQTLADNDIDIRESVSSLVLTRLDSFSRKASAAIIKTISSWVTKTSKIDLKIAVAQYILRYLDLLGIAERRVILTFCTDENPQLRLAIAYSIAQNAGVIDGVFGWHFIRALCQDEYQNIREIILNFIHPYLAALRDRYNIVPPPRKTGVKIVQKAVKLKTSGEKPPSKDMTTRRIFLKEIFTQEWMKLISNEKDENVNTVGMSFNEPVEIDRIFSIYSKDPNKKIKLRFIEILSQYIYLLDVSTLTTVLGNLGSDEDTQIRKKCIGLYVEEFTYCRDAAKNLLIIFANDPSVEVREEVISALLRNFPLTFAENQEEVILAIDKLSGDKEPAVRKKIVNLCVLQYAPLGVQAENILNRLAKDTSDEVRAEVARQVTDYPDILNKFSSIAETIKALSKDTSPVVRKAVCQLIASNNSAISGNFTILTELLEDKETVVREEAAVMSIVYLPRFTKEERHTLIAKVGSIITG